MSNCEQLQEDLFGGPLRASGERKVLHDRYGGVAGAISAHAAFAVPLPAPDSSERMQATDVRPDNGWMHFPPTWNPSSLERQGFCGTSHTPIARSGVSGLRYGSHSMSSIDAFSCVNGMQREMPSGDSSGVQHMPFSMMGSTPDATPQHHPSYLHGSPASHFGSAVSGGRPHTDTVWGLRPHLPSPFQSGPHTTDGCRNNIPIRSSPKAVACMMHSPGCPHVPCGNSSK